MHDVETVLGHCKLQALMLLLETQCTSGDCTWPMFTASIDVAS